MSHKDRSRAKQKNMDLFEDESRHHYKVTKNRQDKKSLKQLDKALKTRDYGKLMNTDDIY